jgi:hypothetical protein
MVLLFCHIEKCAGTTLINQLRSKLGVRHVDLIPSDISANVAVEKDLDATLRRVPFALSAAGHSLKPYIGYGENVEKFTLLRDPVKRYVSEFRHDEERRGFEGSFQEWATLKSRWNHQTKFIAGENDLDKAKFILENEVSLFGLAEKYDEFLELLALRLPQLSSATSEPANKSRIKTKITERDLEIARNANKNDIKLYEFASKLFEHKKQQWKNYTPERYLVPGLGIKANLAFRNFYYKPLFGLKPFQPHALPVNAVNAQRAEKDGICAHEKPKNID